MKSIQNHVYNFKNVLTSAWIWEGFNHSSTHNWPEIHRMVTGNEFAPLKLDITTQNTGICTLNSHVSIKNSTILYLLLVYTNNSGKKCGKTAKQKQTIFFLHDKVTNNLISYFSDRDRPCTVTLHFNRDTEKEKRRTRTKCKLQLISIFDWFNTGNRQNQEHSA